MPRHKRPRPTLILPDWIKTEVNDCLVSVGEEVHTARQLAAVWKATELPQCQELLRAGDKSLAILNDTRASVRKRTDAGERALRKFWEAKSCARRVQLGR